MASAGGHWMKATTGPFAGSMVFVPGQGSGTALETGAKAGVGSYNITKNATVQGGLAVYQNEHGDWVVAHAGSGVSLGPAFTTQAGALVAMEELNQMGGKLWLQDGSQLANTPGLKDATQGIMSKHKDIATITSYKEAKKALDDNYSINQKAAKPAAEATTTANKTMSQTLKETTPKANPANYSTDAEGNIKGVTVQDTGVPGKIAYNQNTGKFDVIDSDGNVVSSHSSFDNAKTYGPVDLETISPALGTQPTAGTASTPTAGYQKGKLTQPVPQNASQDFKDYAEDVQVTYKMGKTTTKAGVPIDVGHPDGKPSITFNEKTGQYHANDISGKTISTHNSMAEAGQAIGKMYAPKTPSGAYASAPKASVTINGQQVEGVKVEGGTVVFDKFSGQYTLHTTSGTAVPGFASLETAKQTATALQGTAGSAGKKWAEELYGDVYKADNVMSQAAGVHAKAMTQAEHAGMAAWQGNTWYSEMNDHLWKGTPASPTALKHIANVKSGMAKGQGLPQDMILERKKWAGSSMAKLIDNLQVGQMYVSKGLDATSIKKGMWSGDYTIKYHAPKGLKGFYMNAKGYKSKYSNEMEFLVAPNTAWKVIGKYKNEYGGWTAEVVFVGQE